MELLLYDVEDRETVIESVAAMQAMADSAERASQSIEKLPADLQKSLADSQGALQEANKALLTAKDVLVPLGQVTDNLKLASDTWGTILAPDPNAPPSRPFDIREWQETAAQIGTSANELRALAIEINTLTGSTRARRRGRSRDRARRPARRAVLRAAGRVPATRVATRRSRRR